MPRYSYPCSPGTPASNAVAHHHFLANGSGVGETTTPFRYVWPSELDLMVRLAG